MRTPPLTAIIKRRPQEKAFSSGHIIGRRVDVEDKLVWFEAFNTNFRSMKDRVISFNFLNIVNSTLRQFHYPEVIKPRKYEITEEKNCPILPFMQLKIFTLLIEIKAHLVRPQFLSDSAILNHRFAGLGKLRYPGQVLCKPVQKEAYRAVDDIYQH
jgi:hypothetical protein